MTRKKQTKDIIIDYILQNYEYFTYEELTESLNNKFKTNYTSNAVRKLYQRYSVNPSLNIISSSPRVLFLDIETAPLLSYVWGLWNNDVSLNQVHTDWYILSWSAKWQGSDEIFYEDQRHCKNVEDDKKLMKNIWKLLDEADIVVGHNSKAFDIKKLNARFIIHGMTPPSSFRQIDTKVIASSKFKFTSNKLEYLTNKLCTKNKKSKHTKFTGFELWKECLAGNIEAWKEMEQYNKMDVLSLEELYNKLVPWSDHINFTVYSEENKCSCGSTNFKKHGFYYTNSSKFQKYKCLDCGTEYRDKSNLLKKKPFTQTKR